MFLYAKRKTQNANKQNKKQTDYAPLLVQKVKKTTTEVFVIKRANISTALKKGATYLGKAAGSYVRGRTSVNRHRIYEEEDQKLRS